MQPTARACEHPREASQRSTKRRHDVNVEINGYSHPRRGVTTPLSVGLGVGDPYGGVHADTILFGPELEFGNVVGNHIKKQVLLLKYAVGGSSLYKNWRPPSATTSRPLGPRVCGNNCGANKCMPDYAEGFKLENKADECCDFCCVSCDDAKCKVANGGSGENCKCGRSGTDPFLSDSCAQHGKEKPTTGLVGEDYQGMVSTIKNRLDEIGTKGVDYKIAGFAWFQGWSDASRKPDWVEDECN